MRLYGGISDSPQNGSSTKLLTEVVILNWDEQPLSAFPKLWVSLDEIMITPKSCHKAVRSTELRLHINPGLKKCVAPAP